MEKVFGDKMMDVDYELDRGLMCQAVGKAVSSFVIKHNLDYLTVTVACDKPDVTYDSEGKPLRGVNVRVYVDSNIEEDDE